MPGREELVEYLQKLAEGPIRRTPIDPHRLGWATGLEFEEAKAEEQLFYCFPPYPARLDGKNYMEGQIITIKFDDNLVSLWDMAEGEGTILYDRVVKNRNNGTIYGATWAIDPEQGNCLSFDGVDDYVLVPHHASLAVDYLTLEAWIYMTGTAAYRLVAGKVNSTDTRFYFLRRHTDDRIVWSLRTPLQSADLLTVCPLETKEWYHIAGTWDGTYARIYVNGTLNNEMTAAFGPIAPEDRDFMIGALYYAATWYWDGLIDEVRIYNRALDADTIAKHAQRNYWNQDYVWG